MVKQQKRPVSAPRPPGDLNPRSDPPLDFPDLDFGELTAADYDALGFICGLEVHQQIATRRKLFCRCPAGRSVSRFDAEALRRMRPTLSELGEYDGTALMEFKTRKEIVYRLDRGTVCTYELDDTPPFEIDADAVRIALEVARLFDLNLVSELHVMRKQYLDGSIPTGFQRTAMIGLTGSIPFRVPDLGVNRELSIRQLSLEEDSCREVSDIGHRITFRTDRLGTPLTETVTEPELVTPWEVQAAGRLLAQVAQVTGKVRRGPGAARQDVNVSVAGGRRVEIKGVDNHRSLPLLVHTEALRQLNLLRIRHEVRRRGVGTEILRVPETGLPWEDSPLVVDAGSILKRCDFAPLREALDRGHKVCALRLRGFGGLLTHRTQPGVTFAREFSQRVRVVACLESRPFMLHSDLRDYGLDSAHWRRLRKRLRSDRHEDTLVVIWGPEADAATAVREVYIRAREALIGIPPETRQVFADGTNGFERILPGPDRMYPDTDTPPLPISDDLLHEIESKQSELPWTREDRYESLGLSTAEAQRLAASDWHKLFDELAPPAGDVARRVARALEKRLPHHRRRHGLRDLPSVSRLRPLIDALTNGTIRLEATEAALDALFLEPDNVLTRFTKTSGDDEELGSLVATATRLSPDISGDALLRWAMGQVMPRVLGRIDPLHVQQLLTRTLP
jgi:glutamyl-tRNA(Gln) amidotransferase subunit E